MAERPALTARQREIYEFIGDRIRACGYAPTIREIGAHLGIRSTNGVADHLKALKRKGYLSQAASKSRTWQPLGAGVQAHAAPAEAQPTPPGRAVPVPVLGRVAAGEPILAEEHAEGTLHVDAAMLPRSGKLFALHVVGDSMIEAGIRSGDMVFVSKRDQAERGNIVVVVIDDEATVKHYYPEGDHLRLQPANASMQPIIVHADDARQVQIMGVVVGVYRRLP